MYWLRCRKLKGIIRTQLKERDGDIQLVKQTRKIRQRAKYKPESECTVHTVHVPLCVSECVGVNK